MDIAPDLSPPLPALEPASVRDLAATVAAVTSITLPVFLTGTLAVQIRDSLHFGPSELGVVVGCYYAAAAIAAAPSGTLAERWGGLRMLRASALATVVCLVAVALAVGSWPALGAALILGGLASSAGQTGSNLFLARRVAPGRQGLAFGVKQAAVPLAALLGGLAVPAIALTVGWRWAFAAAAILATASALLLPRPRLSLAQQRASTRAPGALEPTRPLVVLALGFGLALLGCSSLGAFLVTSAVAGGVSRGAAGLLAAAASLAGVAIRVLVGILADRRGGRHFPFVTWMIVSGALGFVLLATAATLRIPILFLPGAVVAFGIGWGWNGLFNFAVVRTHGRAPARATGITQTGGRLGSVIGPLLFGVLATHLGYGPAWAIAAGELLAGAAVLAVGRLMLQSSRVTPAAQEVEPVIRQG